MHIREAVSSDKAAIERLFLEELQYFGYTPDVSLDADISGFPKTYDSGYFCVGEVDGKIIAMGGILNGELRRVYLNPNMRGKGLGRKLLEHLVGFNPKKAVVRKDNLVMQSLIQSVGFKEVGTHPVWVFCTIYLRD